MKTQNNGTFRGKKIMLVTEDESLRKKVLDILRDHNAIIFDTSTPKDAVSQMMIKKPELVIYDDRMPNFQGSKLLPTLKRSNPKLRTLYMTKYATPQRAMDTSAQGITHTLPFDANEEQTYQAIKHSLSITSVPRVEIKN